VRIGLDYRPAYAERGGIPVYVRALVAALGARFPEDRLLLYGLQARRRAAVRAGRARARPASSRLFSAPLPSRAAEALSRLGVGPDRLLGGCDVFHSTDYVALSPSSAPLVATVHDVLFEELPRAFTPAMRRGLRAATRRIVRGAARVVVPSARTKHALVERYRADPERVDVVPLAPRDLPDAPADPSLGRYVLAVGTLEPRKNLDRLLAAHRRALARGADADLVVVGGRGWIDDAVHAALARTPRVRWEGGVGDERLASLYRGALALAYPSLGEGYGLPVAEAMRAGCPAVTSAGTACEDLAGGAALLVDPYDVESIADALERVARDDALREDLARRGRARAAPWSWERTAEGTRAAYERACVGPRAPDSVRPT
jgi:glycosyltransferase involved in cell wall biosynthesis